MLLAVHEAIRDVVPPESPTELSPRHLVVGRKGGGEGHATRHSQTRGAAGP
jgi:hypothetical protein